MNFPPFIHHHHLLLTSLNLVAALLVFFSSFHFKNQKHNAKKDLSISRIEKPKSREFKFPNAHKIKEKMCKVSNFLIFFMNLLTLLISIAIIFSASHHKANVDPNSECMKFIRQPLLIFGLFLLFVSLLGAIGACSRLSIFLWIYIAVMFLLILGLLCFTIFTIVVTNKGVGRVVSGKGFDQYRLGDYSNWLQKHVVSGKNWDTIRNCFVKERLCKYLDPATNNVTAIQELPIIQSNCCMPPLHCGFTFINATVWNVPKTGPAVPDTDCTIWSNVQDTLCFDCNSCKAGLLANLKSDWKVYTKINITMLIILLTIYSVACCAFKNNRNAHYERYRGY